MGPDQSSLGNGIGNGNGQAAAEESGPGCDTGRTAHAKPHDAVGGIGGGAGGVMRKHGTATGGSR